MMPAAEKTVIKGSRFLAILILLCTTSVASAVDKADAPKAVIDAIHKLVPNAEIQSIEVSEIAGYYAVVAGGQVVYVSTDGRYLIKGSVYDLVGRADLTAVRMDTIRRVELAKVPNSKRIIFAPENPKYTVSVFTDLDCAYCRKLHSRIKEYNAKGIAVEYLLFPRAGIGSHSWDKAVSVFCAANPEQAFTAAKQGAEPDKAACDNPVASEYALGQRIGIGSIGTPTVIAADGSILGGYRTPDELLRRLQAIDAQPTGSAAPQTL